jgi:hypothetical protein
VKRCVSVFFCFSLFFTAHPAFADDGPTNRPVLQDGKTGRVGIGTAVPQTALDVYQGEIKIGSSGAACTTEIAGALRSENEHLQFCDGAGWRNVSLDKAQ